MGRLSLLFLVLVALQLAASWHSQHDYHLKNCYCKACHCWKPHPPCHKPPPDHKPPCHKPPPHKPPPHWPPPDHKPPPHWPPPDHKPPPHWPPPDHKPPPHWPPPDHKPPPHWPPPDHKPPPHWPPPDHKPPPHWPPPDHKPPPHWPPPDHKPPPHWPPPDHKPPPHWPPPDHKPPHKPPPHKPPPHKPPFCPGKKECAVAKIRAKTLLIPLSPTLRNKVKEQIDRRLELFGLGKFKNGVDVEVKTILILRYVIVKISTKCCPKILQIVLDALSGPELSGYVVRPPSVVRYCSHKRKSCSVSDEFISGEDAHTAEAAEAIQEEKIARAINKYTSNENEGNTDEGKVNNDQEVSNEVSDNDNTTTQTEEPIDGNISNNATSNQA